MRPELMNALAVAYLGDAVFEVYVREYLLTEKGIMKPHELQRASIKYVSAYAHAGFMKYALSQNFFTEEEVRLFKRGRNCKGELLTGPRQVHEVMIQNQSKNDDIVKLCRKNNIKMRMTDKNGFINLVGNVNHQGVMALIDGYDYTPLEDIVRNIPEGKQPLLLMLDGMEDPHNLGAIIRTCDAIGVDGVIIGKKRSVGLNATVAKVSTGAIDHVPVAQVTNLSRTLDSLKKEGFWVVGCELDNSTDYRAVDYNMPLVLVIGSEGFGISRLVKEHCDMNVILPMVGHVNSLNASVATAVLLYQVYNSRHPL